MLRTALYDLHRASGAKLVSFAGYEMPLHYADGILKEHLHTRHAASLFDVSHMGQIAISGPDAVAELECVLPLDLDALAIDRQAYSFLPNDHGGVIDDVMIARRASDSFIIIANAGCKEKVMQHMKQHLASSELRMCDDRALLALQGPASCEIMRALFGDVIAALPFMALAAVKCAGVECTVSRSGYTGEDGFEISVPSTHAEMLAKQLLAQPAVKWAGLGARDSLRLEAGLCLYGHELSEDISPIAAGLGWTISKARREGQKAGKFTDAGIILPQLKNGTITKRVGLAVQSKIPVREGAIVCDTQGNEVGKVTSGIFSPTLNQPVAMGYIDSCVASNGTILRTMVRSNAIDLVVTRLPFVAHRYVRK